ncbi:MAG: resolvase [Clostridiales bacterium 36_14]|nr:MAG: resolvase [Clostridiales bacterium 36_14]
MGNYFSYMRISTKEERGKQKYTRQENSLERYARNQGIDYVIQFREDASGKSFINRSEWNRLEKIIQSSDTIVFKDITRFTREAENGYAKYMELMSKGINLVFLDNPTLSTDYIKNLIVTSKNMNFLEKTISEMLVKVLLAAELTRAEQERLTISQRTRDGMAASPNKAGRKLGQLDKMTEALKNDIRRYLTDKSIKQVDLMNKYKISRNTLKKYISLLADTN